MGRDLLIARFTLLVAFIAFGVLPSTLQAESADAIKIEFVGNEIIPSKILKAELQSNPDYFFDAYSGKPIEELVPLSERLLVAGYKNSGFPNATVKVAGNENGLTIQINEGKRYRNGEIIVTGVDAAWQEQITDRLMRGSPKGDVLPTFVSYNGEPKIAWKKPDGKDADFTEPLWKPNATTSFIESENLSAKVLEAVRELASSDVELTSSVVLTDDGKSELHIDVTSLGTPRQAREIHFTGIYDDQKTDVLELVNLQPGDGVDASKICEMTHTLWKSGRFKKHHVHWHPWEADTLTLDLELMPGVPWLDETLSENAQTVLKCVDWLSRFGDRTEDIRIDCTLFSAIVSPTGAYIHKALPDTDSSDQASETVARALVDQTGLSIDHTALENRLHVPPFGNNLYLTGSVSVASQKEYSLPGEESKSDLLYYNFRFDFNPSRGFDRPVNLKLHFNPAEFLTLAYRDDVVFNLEDATLNITRGDKAFVVEKSTGKLISYKDDVCSVVLGTGLFAEAKKAFDAKPNGLDTNHLVPGLLGAVSKPEYWHALEVISGKTLNPNYQSLIAKAAKLEVFDLINEWASSQFDSESNFHIPHDTLRWQNYMSKQMAAMALHIGSFFPQNSWPTKIATAEAMIACGRNRDATKIIDEIVADPLSGPLCLGVLAACLDKNTDSRTNSVAALGEKRLVTDDIYCDLLWLNNFIPARIHASIVQFASSLTSEEVDALIELSSNKSMKAFLVACRDSDPNQPVLQNVAAVIAEGGYFKDKLHELAVKIVETKVPESWERYTKFNQDKTEKDKKDTKPPENTFPKLPWE